MKQRALIEKRREYDGARRAIRQSRTGEEGTGRTVNCRHRVRLVFGSEEGRAAFGRVIARVMR
jgi:hypothetical protein